MLWIPQIGDRIYIYTYTYMCVCVHNQIFPTYTYFMTHFDCVRADLQTAIYEKAGVLYNIGYPSETHLKLQSREISFVHNTHLNIPIVLGSFYP